jgi:hypothetical protein
MLGADWRAQIADSGTDGRSLSEPVLRAPAGPAWSAKSPVQNLQSLLREESGSDERLLRKYSQMLKLY